MRVARALEPLGRTELAQHDRTHRVTSPVDDEAFWAMIDVARDSLGEAA